MLGLGAIVAHLDRRRERAGICRRCDIWQNYLNWITGHSHEEIVTSEAHVLHRLARLRGRPPFAPLILAAAALALEVRCPPRRANAAESTRDPNTAVTSTDSAISPSSE